ncbi:TBC1 domain member 31 [Coelomomyces lativittatus]|nr:TBC1 domain member 31 [Coelomomyces lativittatus]KAJ1513191.1 TBC1 domain member 31 [Coelomomyces lativittatus]
MIEKSLPEPSTRKFTKDLKSKETKPQTYYYLPPKSVDPTFKSTEVDAHFNKLKKEENELLSFYEKAPFQKKNTMPSPSSISTARSNLKKKNLTEKKKGTLPKKNNTPTPITTSKNGSSLSSNLSHLSPSTSLSNLMKTSRLSKPKLQRYLTHYGRYPEAYRVMIWRYLLKLPENKTAFHHFYDQPIHPAYVHFYETFPIKSSSLAQATQRILSCLAYWSPLFENLVYLPPLVFPIVKTCYPDVLTAFEVSLMVILNVCQRWWEYYPNPPIDCLVYAEDMVKDLDPVLYDHFRCYGIGPHEYLWPCFQTLFSETLRKEHWWMFMDHLFTYQSTSFLYVFAAHVLKSYRSALLRLQSGQHVLRFMTRLHPLNVKLSELDPNSMMSISTALFPSSFVTLSEEMYPLFTGYPTCIVAYESKLYAQIRSEEEAYLRRRHVVKEWLQLKQRLDLDQQRWERSDWRVKYVFLLHFLYLSL